jgi:hypothetical protein
MTSDGEGPHKIIIVNTAIGKIPVTDEFIPRKDWDAYMEMSRQYARDAWCAGVGYTALTIEQFRKGYKKQD